MEKYDKYLVESKNVAGSIAELAIEKMEDTLADFEMFLDEKLEKAQSGPAGRDAYDIDVRTVKALKNQFNRSFGKQWESMKKDLIIIGRKLDQLK